MGFSDLPRSPTNTIIFKVSGEFRSSESAARESALIAAQRNIREMLARLDPGIHRTPSLETIRTEMIFREDKPQIEVLNKSEKMYKITLGIELRPEHLQYLRQGQRIISTLSALAAIEMALVLIFILIRFDDWTKGFLTPWIIACACSAVLVLLILWLKFS